MFIGVNDCNFFSIYYMRQEGHHATGQNHSEHGDGRNPFFFSSIALLQKLTYMVFGKNLWLQSTKTNSFVLFCDIMDKA